MTRPVSQVIPDRFSSRVGATLLSIYGDISGLYKFRGFRRLTALLGTVVSKDAKVTVRLNSDSRFQFKLLDSYWNRLLSSAYEYEPELARFLSLIALKRFTFIDGGANYGYWSTLVSSTECGEHKAIAIEPVSTTFAALCANAKMNGNRFSSFQAAITGSGAGEEVTIKYDGSPSGSHASASIVDWDASIALTEETVKAVTIDELVLAHCESGDPVVVKIDLEGVEVDAMAGMVETMKRDFVLVYEDHGKEKTSRVTAHLLDMGLNVWFLESNGTQIPIHSVAELTALKKDKYRGYNLVATSPKDQYFTKAFAVVGS